MNKILLLSISILVGCALSLNAQKKKEVVYEKPNMPIDELSNKITYTKVVEATGSKEELFRKALTWYNNYYKNPSEVIREKDSAEGKILGKGRIKILNPADKKGIKTMKGIVLYTLTCELKDGRFKYTVTDVNLKATSFYACEKWLDTESQTYSQVYNFFLTQVDEEIQKTTSDLVKTMTKAAENKPEEW